MDRSEHIQDHTNPTTTTTTSDMPKETTTTIPQSPRELYNDIAVDYSAIKTNPYKKYIEEKTFLDAVGDITNQSVLDLGCGAGHFCRILAETHGAKTIHGIDVSDAMVDEAKKIEASDPKGIQYHRLDLLDDGSNDLSGVIGGPVDVCASEYLFPYASNVEGVRKFCAAAANAVRPGGRFVAVTTVYSEAFAKAADTTSGGGIVESNAWGFATAWDGTTEVGDGMLADVTLFGSRNKTTRATFPNFFWSRNTLAEALRDAGFASVEWREPRVDETTAPPGVVAASGRVGSEVDMVGYFVATKA